MRNLTITGVSNDIDLASGEAIKFVVVNFGELRIPVDDDTFIKVVALALEEKENKEPVKEASVNMEPVLVEYNQVPSSTEEETYERFDDDEEGVPQF